MAQFKNRNNPKVANAPPAPSRRINPNPINSAGEEVHAEEFGRGSIIGEVEILTGANWVRLLRLIRCLHWVPTLLTVHLLFFFDRRTTYTRVVIPSWHVYQLEF